MQVKPTPRGSLVSSGRGGVWSIYDNVIGQGLRSVHEAAVTEGSYRAGEEEGRNKEKRHAGAAATEKDWERKGKGAVVLGNARAFSLEKKK